MTSQLVVLTVIVHLFLALMIIGIAPTQVLNNNNNNNSQEGLEWPVLDFLQRCLYVILTSAIVCASLTMSESTTCFWIPLVNTIHYALGCSVLVVVVIVGLLFCDVFRILSVVPCCHSAWYFVNEFADEMYPEM
jgi:hypothetical protein